ncbi:GNAT family N-acetyltransferase [Psychromonas algicola]|uniref:GNAT family N-acetyltransferase n=1 Tax=Psychromonas algicola TaxID=2555642 RepID=UPI001067C1ED|nr:GNAT family N-acetyltransferase [Psychromonas sp. RZ5]TEW51731.1 GNAT family N-acetyltransferase [Psychromonas sp. RZ5]
MQVVELTAQQTIPIRHKVLWPNELPEYCMLKGDDKALHFGVTINNKLVSVASIYMDNDPSSARLRKFATLAEFQGKGIGSHLLNHIIQILSKCGVTYFWFDARSSAVNFYQGLGFQISGELFYKNKVSYYKMHANL